MELTVEKGVCTTFLFLRTMLEGNLDLLGGFFELFKLFCRYSLDVTIHRCWGRQVLFTNVFHVFVFLALFLGISPVCIAAASFTWFSTHVRISRNRSMALVIWVDFGWVRSRLYMLAQFCTVVNASLFQWSHGFEAFLLETEAGSAHLQRRLHC